MPNSLCDLPNAKAIPPVARLHDIACTPADERKFYPEQGEHAGNAKAICARCPHVEACLRWALDTGQRYGVWGGLTADERHALTDLPPGRKGRGKKLTAQQAATIRTRHAAGMSMHRLAQLYGVSSTLIRLVVNDVIWRTA